EIIAALPAVDQELDDFLAILVHDPKLDIHPARESLFFRVPAVVVVGFGDKERRLRGGRSPAVLDLCNVALSNLAEPQVELPGDVGHVPKNIAKLLADTLLEEFVRRPVAQKLLVLTEQATRLASQTEQR